MFSSFSSVIYLVRVCLLGKSWQNNYGLVVSIVPCSLLSVNSFCYKSPLALLTCFAVYRPCHEENTARAVISTCKFICVCDRTCKKISTYGQRGSRNNAKEEKHTIEVRFIEKTCFIEKETSLGFKRKTLLHHPASQRDQNHHHNYQVNHHKNRPQNLRHWQQLQKCLCCP